MQNNNKLSIYASSIKGKDKKELLAIYREYVMLVNHFEYIQKKHHPKVLASYMAKLIGISKDNVFPFTLGGITPKETENYQNFIKAVPRASNPQYAYINILTTNPNDKEENMYSIPEGFDVYTDVKSLPHFIERINIAFPKNAYPQDLTYNINGKYTLTYNINRNIPLKELLNYKTSDNFKKTLFTILSVVSQLPDDYHNLEQSSYEKANIEGNIAELMADYENVILSSLSNLTEKQDRILKQLLFQRERLNYLTKAENQGLITSEYLFQDLLNIRHLLHHQFDTLEGFGRFMHGNNNQNQSIRKRNLESYNRLFNKTFAQRVNTYRDTLDNLKPLVEELCPNILIRQKQESKNKFIQRIKEYQANNPSTDLYVELNLKETSTKESFIKNIKKVSPQTIIIDDIPEKDFEDFSLKIKTFMERQKFLETFQLLESTICTYCLYNGYNLRATEAWSKIISEGLIKEEDISLWNNFKALRNELTHEYLDDKLINKMTENFDIFLEKSFQLNDIVDSLSPQIIDQTKEGIITFRHKDNRIIIVDVKNKKVINAISPKGENITLKNNAKQHNGSYMENLSNNIRLTTKGTKITKVKLSDNIEIDFLKKTIIFPDNNKLFLNKNNKHYLVTSSNKVITDSNFTILSYIQKQKEISFHKNETISFPNGYTIDIDNSTKLKRIKFTHSNQTYSANIQNTPPLTKIQLSDNTIITLNNDELKVSHNNIELNYITRKDFANSYSPIPPSLTKKER